MSIISVALSFLALTGTAHYPPRSTLPQWEPRKPRARLGLDQLHYHHLVFLQDEPTTDPGTFDYTATNFGLINCTHPTDSECDKSFIQWRKFGYYVDTLNAKRGRNVNYNVLYMGRHGEGYHNATEAYYGTPA